MKSGYIALLGRPNAGKSSLMNAFVGEKVAIVSPKPQTTRDRITGILTSGDSQMIFVDTPGYHNPKNELGKYMERAIQKAAADVDVILVVLDGSKSILLRDLDFIEEKLNYKIPVYVAVNKTDIAGYEKIYPVLETLQKFVSEKDVNGLIKEIIPVSAKKGTNVDKLKELLQREMPEGDFLFPEDEISDKTERYMVSEIIREKALLFLQEEVPHGIGIVLQKMEFDKKLASIEADIICEKDSHKTIVIGEDGKMIRQIGMSARPDIESLLGCRVYLKLFVKVRGDWRNRRSIMSDAGYET